MPNGYFKNTFNCLFALFSCVCPHTLTNAIASSHAVFNLASISIIFHWLIVCRTGVDKNKLARIYNILIRYTRRIVISFRAQSVEMLRVMWMQFIIGGHGRWSINHFSQAWCALLTVSRMPFGRQYAYSARTNEE